MNAFVEEKRYSTNINFILSNANIFYEVGYKVLQNQDSNGFLKCIKVMHNGKIKLVYDISKYKDLETELQNCNLDVFIKIVRKLLTEALKVKENGFIEYKNINSNLNTIFIDTNNYNIYYLYLPIVGNDERSEKSFTDELKQNILKAINYNHQLQGDIINNLCTSIVSNESLADILKDINNIDSKLYEKEETDEIYEVTKKHSEGEEKGSVKDKAGYKSPFGRLFSRTRKNEVTENNSVHTPLDSRVTVERYSNNGTTVLNQNKNLKIALKGVNTSVDCTIFIEKSEFIIGSRREYADGVISFNKAISRKHCSILKQDGIYYIVDEGSSNGTFVNEIRLEQNVKKQITPGDIIKLANSEFIVVEVI